MAVINLEDCWPYRMIQYNMAVAVKNEWTCVSNA